MVSAQRTSAGVFESCVRVTSLIVAELQETSNSVLFYSGAQMSKRKHGIVYCTHVIFSHFDFDALS